MRILSNAIKRAGAVFAAIFASIAGIPAALAHCPLCTAAVGVGVAISRFYGVDDTIVGVWIGAFILSTALWFDRALKKKHGKPFIPLQTPIFVALAFIFTVVPFYYGGLIGDARFHIYGIDKLFLGIVVGTIASGAGLAVSEWVKKTKKKVLFPFQTILITLAFLVVSSIAFFQITM